ncbi:MAG: hypothetical protein RJA35_58 [Actinomycetota bacterium]|jgi:DNA-binding NarL/FixJ family response regulator
MVFTLRVLLVEDDNLLRGLLRDVLLDRGYEVETASSAKQAIKIFEEFDPDLAVLDIDLGYGPTGIDLAHSMRKVNQSLSILFLTHIPDPRFAGFDLDSIPSDFGYLHKDRIVDTDLLAEAIESVARGRARQDFRDHSIARNPMQQLSQAQLEVLKLVAKGKSNEQIAAVRGTTERAVRGILARALDIVGIEDDGGERRVAAAIAFIRASTGDY